jgi:hypothetical protein
MLGKLDAAFVLHLKYAGGFSPESSTREDIIVPAEGVLKKVQADQV